MISTLKQFFIWLKSENYRSDNLFAKIQTPKSNISLPSLSFFGVAFFAISLRNFCGILLKIALNLVLTLSDDGECHTFFDSLRNY